MGELPTELLAGKTIQSQMISVTPTELIAGGLGDKRQADSNTMSVK